MDLKEIIVTILTTAFASAGFWALIQNYSSKKSAKTQMLLGLAHDRIVFLGMEYIKRGYVTKDEYENLYNYLYTPYEKLGGNGSASRIMEEVKRLPIHEN